MLPIKVLKPQDEKRSAIAARKARVYPMVTTPIFTPGKVMFYFDQYVGRHQQEHNELLLLEDADADNTKKDTGFLACICDPKLVETGACFLPTLSCVSSTSRLLLRTPSPGHKLPSNI